MEKTNNRMWDIENLTMRDIDGKVRQNFGILTKEGRIALLGNNQESNASLIVKAVNCHDELVEALKLALKSMLECDDRQHIKRHSYDPIFKAQQALFKSEQSPEDSIEQARRQVG